jgi:hypothetical protein
MTPVGGRAGRSSDEFAPERFLTGRTAAEARSTRRQEYAPLAHDRYEVTAENPKGAPQGLGSTCGKDRGAHG